MSIMRKLSILAFSITIGILTACSTPATSIKNEKIKAEVLSSLQGFQSAYNLMDVKEVSDHFNNPTTLIGPGGVSISIKRDDFNNTFIPVTAYLANKDYKHSKWRNIDIKVLDKDLAIASADIIQYDTSNEIIESFGVTFSMSHDGGDWRISTVSTHPPSDLN